MDLSISRSEFTRELLPYFNLTWSERLKVVKEEIAALVPTGGKLILVDQGDWGGEVFENHQVIPFLEREWVYGEPPSDEDTAIREFKRLRRSGAKFIVFGWPAFWWLDYYSGLKDYLHSEFNCMLKNSRLIVFDLQHKT